MDVACPQCGNPNLDVDAQNNVVYCRKCGFAVQVDPATGNVTPLSQGGGAPAGGMAAPTGRGGAPATYAGGKTVFGLEPFTFMALGVGVILLLGIIYNLSTTLIAALCIVMFLLYFYFKR
jgi:hypothetical protein